MQDDKKPWDYTRFPFPCRGGLLRWRPGAAAARTLAWPNKLSMEQKESEIQQVNYEPAPVRPHHKEEKSKEKKQANKSSPALKIVE